MFSTQFFLASLVETHMGPPPYQEAADFISNPILKVMIPRAKSPTGHRCLVIWPIQKTMRSTKG